MELGKTVQDTPDAWCYLRESVNSHKQTVKNFERWLYQRDADGARTEATEKVEVPTQMFDFDKQHLYDLTARKTQVAKGQSLIRFGVDDAFLSGGPHAIAVKINYVDRANAEWQLEYFTGAKTNQAGKVTCGDSGVVKTATYILKDAYFPGQGYTGLDFQIRALKGDAVIRFVRVVKLNSKTVKP